MFSTDVTTDSIVKPLMTMIDKLQKHQEKQKANIQGINSTIAALTNKKDAAILDAEKAANIVNNLQKLTM